MKLFKKLNQAGIAHVAALAVVVVAIAVVGTYVVVKSHASTLDWRISGFGGYSCKSTDTLGQGNAGACVKALQWGLDNWINRCHINTPILQKDGLFGSKTTTGVKVFQAKHSLVQDGVVGPKTWNAFFGEYAVYWPTGSCKPPTNGK
jgi:peptidoglycan hydrolase-like protein with peptidoglycan-binding domain